MRVSVDSRDDEAIAMQQRVDNLYADVSARLAFVQPELLSIGWQTISGMLDTFPELERYRFLLSELERQRDHTRSPEEEAIIMELSAVNNIPDTIRNVLHDGEMDFRPIHCNHVSVKPSHGKIDELLQSTDRDVRKDAYSSYTDAYRGNIKTLATVLTSQVTTSLVFNRVRRFNSTFESTLFGDAFSPSVYRAAMQSCRELQPLFHRYFRAKAKVLGLEKLAEYDLFAPLSPHSPVIPYEKAIEIVLGSLAPLGDEYVEIAKKGLGVERWVHVFPAPGKSSDAFSAGTYGTHPFILLNYTPSVTEVGTLAHELGHSMHSYFTNRAQPSCYSNYSTSVSETASNLNQVLLRAHILQTADRAMTCAVLDEAFYFAHRYLFLMPTLSRVEHAIHSIYARGGALGASDISRATVTEF
jgi:oligoendopeptidase F